MGLTDKELTGALNILKLVEHHELLSLAKTVTKGQLDFSNSTGKQIKQTALFSALFLSWRTTECSLFSWFSNIWNIN